MKNIIYLTEYFSDCGKIILGEFENSLCLCIWNNNPNNQKVLIRMQKLLNAKTEYQQTELLKNATRELKDYFDKKRKLFDIPILYIGTGFQRKVLRELKNIPYGRTISYKLLAKNIGNPNAVRAVANSNASNPISIFLPCHRVIGSDSKLTGYSGGIKAKQYLLNLEKENLF